VLGVGAIEPAMEEDASGSGLSDCGYRKWIDARLVRQPVPRDAVRHLDCGQVIATVDDELRGSVVPTSLPEDQVRLL